MLDNAVGAVKTDKAKALDMFNKGEAGFRDLLDEAGREIGEVMATDVLIIEDEPLIAMDIEDLVRSLGADVVVDYKKEDFGTKLGDYDLVLHSQDAKALNSSLTRDPNRGLMKNIASRRSHLSAGPPQESSKCVNSMDYI